MTTPDLCTTRGKLGALAEGHTLVASDGSRYRIEDRQLQRCESCHAPWEGCTELPLGCCLIAPASPPSVNDMDEHALWDELGCNLVLDGGYARWLRRLVTQRRRDAEIEAMTVHELAKQFWNGCVSTVGSNCAILDTTRSQQVCWTNGMTSEEAKERLRVCLVALAKQMEGRRA